MTLLTIAELLAGEALISPGGLVDRQTADADDIALWPSNAPAVTGWATKDEAPVPVGERALVTV